MHDRAGDRGPSDRHPAATEPDLECGDRGDGGHHHQQHRAADGDDRRHAGSHAQRPPRCRCADPRDERGDGEAHHCIGNRFAGGAGPGEHGEHAGDRGDAGDHRRVGTGDGVTAWRRHASASISRRSAGGAHPLDGGAKPVGEHDRFDAREQLAQS